MGAREKASELACVGEEAGVTWQRHSLKGSSYFFPPHHFIKEKEPLMMDFG